MTHALVLEAPVKVADGAGGTLRDWRKLGTLWGAMKYGPVREDGGVAVVAVRITVRAAPQGAPSRPVAGQRLRDGERIFDILAVTEAGDRLTCHAEEKP